MGTDVSMGVATFDLKKTQLPFRGNLPLEAEKDVKKKVTGTLEVKVEVE